MSSIVSAVTGGGDSGVNFRAQRADLVNPVTQAQNQEQYGNVQTGIKQQQDFVSALQAQNGLGNQSSVFNQMQGVANGTGPNPAQAMLSNATGANVANQAAMMAGQRGAGANVGMISRQAAQQGANTQQQAAGQGAALQAQQSLGALNQMGGLATNQANQQANATNAFANTANAAQQNILGAQGAYNNANVGMQSNLNSANASLAAPVAGQQGNMLGNMMGGAGSMMQMIPSMFSGSGGGEMMAGGAGDLMGGAGSEGLGEGLTMLAAKGGMVPKKYADGGVTELNPVSGPQSNVGKSFLQSESELGAYNPAMPQAPIVARGQPSGGDMSGLTKGIGEVAKFGMQHAGAIQKGIEWLGSDVAAPLAEGVGAAAVEFGPAIAMGAEEVAPAAVMLAAKGGKVPALVSPGERYLSPKAVDQVKKGADPIKSGEKIPGKPKVKGNSYENDTVPKTLESGGIVLPNSVMQSKHPHWAAHKFVSAILKEQALKKGK